MIRSDQLRQALNEATGNTLRYDFEWEIIKDAARFALRVWEGDEQLVEKVARVLQQGPWNVTTTVDRPLTEGHLFAKARAVLAAISEEEE